jgi:hypothetical protein
LLLAWLSIAHALKFEQTTLGAVHGWTPDGALVLEVNTHKLYWPEGASAEENEEGRFTWAVVISGDKEVHRWLIARTLPAFAQDASPLQLDAWTAWRDSHPLTPASSDRSSPAGVRLEVRAVGNEPEWKGPACDVLGHRDEEESTIATAGLSRAGEGFWPLHRHTIEAPSWQGSLYTNFSARWTPDGRQVALLVQKPTAMTMRGPSFGEIDVVISRAAPLVGVLAPPSVPASVTDKVVAAIAPLGLSQKGEAQAARDSSVVYYASGYEADAKAIAAKVPGGATVAPMDWAGAQQVVVAVGASAR